MNEQQSWKSVVVTCVMVVACVGGALLAQRMGNASLAAMLVGLLVGHGLGVASSASPTVKAALPAVGLLVGLGVAGAGCGGAFGVSSPVIVPMGILGACLGLVFFVVANMPGAIDGHRSFIATMTLGALALLLSLVAGCAELNPPNEDACGAGIMAAVAASARAEVACKAQPGVDTGPQCAEALAAIGGSLAAFVPSLRVRDLGAPPADAKPRADWTELYPGMRLDERMPREGGVSL